LIASPFTLLPPAVMDSPVATVHLEGIGLVANRVDGERRRQGRAGG
jgi:hypothetical protein